MRTTLSFGLLILSLGGGCSSTPEEVCREVSSVWGTDGSSWESWVEYNPQGDRTLIAYRDGQTGRIQVSRDLRDEFGRLVATEVREGEEPDGFLLASREFVYDDNGFLVGSWENEVLAGEVRGRTDVRTFENNLRGLPVWVEVDRDDDGTGDGSTESTWNQRGDRTTAVHVRANGDLHAEERWRYSPSGDLLEHRDTPIWDPNGAEKRTRHEYEAGDLVQTRRWEGDLLVWETVREWEDGLLQSESTWYPPEGPFFHRTEHTYGSSPDTKRTVALGPDGAVIWAGVTTYDDRGNPITFEEERDGSPGLSWTRGWSCFIPEPYPTEG